MFSHMYLLFQLLLSYSCIFAKSLLTNFFAPSLAAWKFDFLSCFLVPLALQADTLYMHPQYFWHRTHGFLIARRSWKPGSRLTTGEFSPFRLLPKVSGANVHWTEHNSYLSCEQVDCCLSYDTFLKLSSRRQCGSSLLQNPQQQDPQCTPAIWHVSQSQSQRTSYLQATTSTTAPKCCGCDARQLGLITQCAFLAFFWVRCAKQSFDGTAFTA